MNRAAEKVVLFNNELSSMLQADNSMIIQYASKKSKAINQTNID